MLIENEILYCDSCGKEMDEEPEFTITMDYGGEDECFGCADDENKLSRDYSDIWGRLRQYLAQPKYMFCDDCRCNKSFAKEFENSARASRVIIFRNLIKVNRISPNDNAARIATLKRESQKLVAELKNAKDMSDAGIIARALDLAEIKNRLDKLNSF